MIPFEPIRLEYRSEYLLYLQTASHRGCAYSFVNQYLWGRQFGAVVENMLVIFSQYNCKSVYLFPCGVGDPQPALEAIRADAAERGIPCRLAGLSQEDCALLERLYPGKFQCHFDRDAFEYVYDINALADLTGRKYQKKRNHLNKFRQNNPEYTLEPISGDNLDVVETLLADWYRLRQAADPHSDFAMEKAALQRALRHRQELELEGLLLKTDAGAVAMTLGSFLQPDTFDVHFEKALDIADGAYPAINQGFAAALREKYPQLRYLNREEDMGLEGLRKAKLSYCPDHMVEKYWVHFMEEYDY